MLLIPSARLFFRRRGSTTTAWPHSSRYRAGAAAAGATTPCSFRSAACSAPSSRRSIRRRRCRPMCAPSTSTSIQRQPSAQAGMGEWGEGVPLVVLESPYRSLMEPLLEYIEHVEHERPERLRHGRAAGVRAGAVVASSVPQPAGAADQGRAALQAEHRRHKRAVSSLVRRRMSLSSRRSQRSSPVGRWPPLRRHSGFRSLSNSQSDHRGIDVLLVVLVTATVASVGGGRRVDLAVAFYFFMPPVGTFTIADPQNWVALFVF